MGCAGRKREAPIRGGQTIPPSGGMFCEAIDPSLRAASSSGRAPDLTQIGADRRRAADWVERSPADDQIEVGAVRPKRIVPRGADFGAGLPPAMLANHHARIEVFVEPGAGSHAAVRRLN